MSGSTGSSRNCGFVRFAAVLGMIMASLTSMSAKDPSSPDVEQALEHFDREFDSVFGWWGKLYDPDSSGFFYSLSARDSPGFGPDIEATTKGVRVLEWTGVLNKTSPEFRQGVVEYMQTRQDPETGFFHDPQTREHYTSNTRSRALGMATDVLRLCGRGPRHPLPSERDGSNDEVREHHAHLKSPETLAAWLNRLPWKTRTWTAGARIRTQSNSFEKMKEPFRGEMLNTVFNYALDKQNVDGIFGPADDSWSSRYSGTYKIASFFDLSDHQVPRGEAMRRTTYAHFMRHEFNNLIVLYNFGNLLELLHRRAEGFSEEEKTGIIQRCTAQIKKFHGPGGGFTTLAGKSAPESNGFRLGEDVVEGNTNATGLAHKLRWRLHALSKDADAPTPHPRSVDFLEALP